MPVRLSSGVAALTTLALAGAGSATAPSGVAQDVQRLAAMMAGSYSSAAQAAADSAFFDVRLRMVPIWTARTDGRWLYVEQAIADSQDKPYRQRVYRVTQDADGTLQSIVYALPTAPLRFAGEWRKDEPLASLTPDSLSMRDGCAILLRQLPDGSYRGATHEHDCPSDLRGARYATSEVTVRDSLLESWDRGFDAKGTQVWGSVAGPYRFVKLSASGRE